MKRLAFSATAVLALAVFSGCSQAVKHAQTAFDRANSVQDDLTTAFFVKGWGMSRIAGSEANARAVAEAKIDLLRAQLDGTFDAAKSEEILNQLSERIAKNEPYVSKSFAWLAFLLQQSERVQSLRGNVDFYLQSQHSIIEQLSGQVPGGWDDLKGAYEDWKPVIGDIKGATGRLLQKLREAGLADPERSQ